MSGETILEINLSDLEKNIRFLKSKIQPETLFLAVVKASSYGNNAQKIASFIQKKNLADYLAVAFCSEGVALREVGVHLPTIVLHPQEAHFQQIIENNLEPVLYSPRILQLFLNFAETNNLVDYPIHLKCNTGLNRLGFSLENIDKALVLLAENKNVRVKTAFSHLVASEDRNEKEFSENQIVTFLKFQEKITKNIRPKVLFHMCNTSGILNYPNAHFDMVRSGIGMYGFANDPDFQRNMTPIGTLKSIISQIHTLEAGESLGYNRSFKATQKTRTATIPVGHADGINRIYGKQKGFVYVNGERAFIIGNVCMDMLMVDVTDVDCEEGDEVILFSPTFSAEVLAENAGTISYELITSMSHRIKRLYIEE